MAFKKIKKLVSLVETSDISSLSVEEDNLKVEIKRELPQAAVQHIATVQPTVAVPEPPKPVQTTPEVAPATDSNLIEIKSPMVGTFYTSPNPESNPFVTPGSSVQKGDIVCMIEAMKLFNEIESDVSGTIEKVCIQNGDAVEFGQTLFLVRPN